MSGYESFNDPYCYQGTFVLKNKAGLREAGALEAFELEMTNIRAEEPLPTGRFGAAHYRAVHRHLFRDVYNWAGRYRTVRTAKGGNAFCYPEHIASEMDKVFGQLNAAPFTGDSTPDLFIEAATVFLADLNAIHPFREGNGRSQLAFMHSVSIRAGHAFDMTRLAPEAFLRAMIKSFGGELNPLQRELRRLLG